MRTLILDDDEIFLAVAESCLASLGSSYIQATTDPVEASDIVYNDHIDLVVLDLNMPEQDGFSFLRSLTEIGFTGGVIIASGEKASVVGSSGYIGEKLGLNICGTLSKPLDMAALTRAYECAKVLQTQHANQQPSIKLVPKGKIEPIYYYQPQIDITTGELIGAEALLRGVDSEGDLFGPYDLLDEYRTAEECFDFVVFLFDMFCKDVQELRNSGFKNRFSFNIDAASLETLDISDTLKNIASNYDIDASGIVIELIESRLPQDEARVLETIARLSMAGFDVSMDDFSVGASSFDLLRAGAFAEIKLDANLVQKSQSDAASAKFIANVVQIAETLQTRLVAEGVETRADANRMQNMGVGSVQGFLIAKPAEKSKLRTNYADLVNESRAAS
ncbi:MAG: EAL domain-containing response regulator [Pseudomonadota bacterium]